MDPKLNAGTPADQGGQVIARRSKPSRGLAATPAKTALVAAKRKATPVGKSRMTAGSRAGSRKKLVCRYCGSDDLAPSFKKRRDRRCRACFKQRYGSVARHKRAQRSGKAREAK